MLKKREEFMVDTNKNQHFLNYRKVLWRSRIVTYVVTYVLNCIFWIGCNNRTHLITIIWSELIS